MRFRLTGYKGTKKVFRKEVIQMAKKSKKVRRPVKTAPEKYGDFPKSFGKVLKRGAGWVYPNACGAYGVGSVKGNTVVTDKGVFVHGFRTNGQAALSGDKRVSVSYVGVGCQINWSDKPKFA